MIAWQFVASLAGVFLLFAALTAALHYVSKGNRYVKYIPALGALLLALYNIYAARFGRTEGMESLGMIVFAMMLFVGFISALATGLLFDLVIRRPRRK